MFGTTSYELHLGTFGVWNSMERIKTIVTEQLGVKEEADGEVILT